MLRTLTIITLLALLPTSTLAATRNCNATLASVTCNNVCSNSGDALLFYSIPTTDPDGAGPLLSVSTRLIEAISWSYNYQAGAETKAQFAERMIRQRIFPDLISAWENFLDEQAKAARLLSNPVPTSVGQ